MRCHRCGRESVYFQRYSGLRLCREHLTASLEARAKGLIRAKRWIQRGDQIAVGLSGGLCSSSLLCFLMAHFGMRPDLSLVAITVDEGARSGMDVAYIREIAEGMGVEWAGTRIIGEDGDMSGPIGAAPRPLFTKLRDHALASLAMEVGATRLALGSSLDDEAKAMFLSVVRGEVGRLSSGVEKGGRGISLIRPFSRIPEEELFLYAKEKEIDFTRREPWTSQDPVERETSRMLLEFTVRHPSALFSLVGIGDALAWRENCGDEGLLPSDRRNPRPGVALSPAPGSGGRGGRIG